MRYALKHSSSLNVFCIKYSLPLAAGSRTSQSSLKAKDFLFTAKHYLFACLGWCFRNHTDQTAVLEFKAP